KLDVPLPQGSHESSIDNFTDVLSFSSLTERVGTPKPAGTPPSPRKETRKRKPDIQEVATATLDDDESSPKTRARIQPPKASSPQVKRTGRASMSPREVRRAQSTEMMDAPSTPRGYSTFQ